MNPTIAASAPSSILPHSVPRWAFWTGALTLAAFATAWLWNASPGLNFPILGLAICGGLLACWRSNGNEWHPDFVIPLVLTAFIATAAAVTDDGPNEIFIALIALLALAAAVAVAFRRGGTRDPRLSWLIMTPLGFFFLVYESFVQAASTYEALCETRSRAALRGVALAVPTTLVLALLLSNADPTFASVRDLISKALLDIAILPQAIFFGLVAVCLVGSAGFVLKATPSSAANDHDHDSAIPLDRPLSDTEPLIVLGAVASLFALFLLLQLSYLFGNPGGQAGSGMSYADAVHRGFGELNLVSTVCGALLLALRRYVQPGPHRPWVRILEGLVRTGLTLGVLAFGGLLYANADAWIARANLARYAESQQIDENYLIRNLGRDAVPTLVNALPTLPPQVAASIKSSLQSWYASELQKPAPAWYEWNWRRQALRTALASLQDPQP